jgi:hypothetical protein
MQLSQVQMEKDTENNRSHFSLRMTCTEENALLCSYDLRPFAKENRSKMMLRMITSLAIAENFCVLTLLREYFCHSARKYDHKMALSQINGSLSELWWASWLAQSNDSLSDRYWASGWLNQMIHSMSSDGLSDWLN